MSKVVSRTEEISPSSKIKKTLFDSRIREISPTSRVTKEALRTTTINIGNPIGLLLVLTYSSASTRESVYEASMSRIEETVPVSRISE